ncbi:MAG: DNA double-strand break repair nuclease NurA [Candidatus Bathyarchaeia archaeon]
MASPLSLHVKRISRVLRGGAEDQVEDAMRRLEAAGKFYDALLSRIIVSNFDYSLAYETALEMFRSPKVRFAAVDGSEDKRLVAGLAVFWGGAYAATGVIEFKPESPPRIRYDTGFMEHGRGVSSCIPLYVDKVETVDQSIQALGELGTSTVAKPLTEQGVIDNSSIADWIMTFSELYLAYKLVEEMDVKILLLDRSLSGTQTSLMYDTSNRDRWETDTAIHSLIVEGKPLDVNEMAYGRHYIANPRLRIPPPRGDYIRYAIVYLLQQRGMPIGLEEISREMGVEAGERYRILEKALKEAVKEGYLEESKDIYHISSRYADAWTRIKRLVLGLAHRLFEEEVENPLRIETPTGLRWMTTLDLAFLSLYTLYMILEECWRRNILLIGLAKDTTARDFKSHVVPVCAGAGIWNIGAEVTENLPSTDRILLQAVSLFNYERIPVPWGLIEYDSAFRTIIPDYERGAGYVSGAIENKIIPERLFVKSYIQLEESERDPRLRSNVLSMDRLAYPEYDLGALIRLWHEYRGVVEPVEPILYRDSTVQNKVQNLALTVLASMSSRSIPEVFGHNKALFIADKIAKAQRAKIKGLIDGLSYWLLNNRRLRVFSFHMHTFRERRAEIEYARRTRE